MIVETKKVIDGKPVFQIGKPTPDITVYSVLGDYKREHLYFTKDDVVIFTMQIAPNHSQNYGYVEYIGFNGKDESLDENDITN